jgi:exopolysaccharide biosynthesis polyprenyl glycosylphosphotransferase
MLVELPEKTSVESRARAVRPARRAPAWMIPAVKTGMFAADIVIAITAFLSAFTWRGEGAVFATSGDYGRWSAEFAPYAALLLFVVAARALANLYYGLYSLRGEFSYTDEALRVLKATAVGSLWIVAAAFLYRGGFEYRAFSYARGVFLLDFVFALLMFGAMRFAVRLAQAMARRRDLNLIPTLVVGRGREAALCIGEMRERPDLGYRIIGVVDSGEEFEAAHEEFEGVPVVGSIDALAEVIVASGAEEVIVTDSAVSGDTLFDVMMQVGRGRKIEFRIAPNLSNALPRKTEIDQIGYLPMIHLFREPLSSTARIIKRSSDILIALLFLVLLSPVYLVIAALIKLKTGGPIIYRQERVGMDGRIFNCYKFRTMNAHSNDATHRDFQQRFINGEQATNNGDSERPIYKLLDDPRITPIGRVLRRWSLDELPQAFNVLRGEMSIVGPRPPIPYEVEAYDLWHRKRLDMKPGMTGLWQVSGRNRLTFEEMVWLDLFYIENWSLLLDLRIILRTLPVILRGEAY